MTELTLAQQELLFRANQDRMEYAPDLPLTWEDLENAMAAERNLFGYSVLEAELTKL